MNLTISGHQLDLTDSLKAYARAKVLKLVEPFEKVIDAHVILGTEVGTVRRSHRESAWQQAVRQG